MWALAPKLMGRYPMLRTVGRWWVWFLVAFLACLFAAFTTHSMPLWVLAFALSQCSAFARVAWRQSRAPINENPNAKA